MRTAVLCIFVVCFCNAGITSAAEWDYKEPDKWPGTCSSGKQQSPIALSPEIAENADFEPFEFHGYDGIYDANLHNNGHTIEIRVEAPRKPGVSGGGLNFYYVLEAMHFHWGSEHTVEGRRFPLELHLVHYDNRSKSLSEALSYTNRVAVFAVLFYVSPDDDSEFVTVYDAIDKLFIQKVKLNVHQTIKRLELDDFLPRDRAGFYRYNGSLTTPGCTEGLVWTVFTNGIPISERQLKIFSKLLSKDMIPSGSNYRPVQDLNDRKVLLKTSGINGAEALIRSTTQMLILFVAVIYML